MSGTPGRSPAAQPTTSLFSGRYQQGSGECAFAGYAGWDAFLAAKQKEDTEGLRLCGLNVYEDAQATTWYTGVWITSNASYGYWAVTDWNSFVEQFNQWAADGLGLVDISLATIQGTLWYTGVGWETRASRRWCTASRGATFSVSSARKMPRHAAHQGPMPGR